MRARRESSPRPTCSPRAIPACSSGSRPALAHLDYLLPNDEQVLGFTGADDLAAGCRALVERGVGCVAATRGADGVVIVDARRGRGGPRLRGRGRRHDRLRRRLLGRFPARPGARPRAGATPRVLGCAAAALVAQGLGSRPRRLRPGRRGRLRRLGRATLTASIPRMPKAGERVTARELLVLVAGRLPARRGHALAAGPAPRAQTSPRTSATRSPQSWQVGLGRPRARPPAAPLLPVEPVLAASRHARVLRRAGRLRARRADRLRARTRRWSATTCSSCSPTRSPSPAPTCWRASSGSGPAAAAVAGAAFAFAPFRLEQDGHLHVISSGGIPLALALGVRGYRLRRPGWVVAGWRSRPGSCRSASRSGSRSPTCSRRSA